MSQHTGSHKNSLNLLGGKYLNESHWPMHRIRLLECTTSMGQCIPWTKSLGPLDLGPVQVLSVGPNEVYSLDHCQLDQVIITC